MENMNWGQHLCDISSKATKTLGFLRRTLAFAPRSTKEVAYKTLVRPKLEYAVPIWSQYGKTQIQRVGKVQRTEARWTRRRWRNTSNLVSCAMSCNGQLWRPRGTSPLCFSSTRFIVGLYLLIKTCNFTPSQRTRSTMSSHNSQYCRPHIYMMP